ncbi:MAG: DUF962 domain-containing protein [Bacteroidota bacterium]|nr:DUF962 domain-containing protein [Bacteroidota bacterium]
MKSVHELLNIYGESHQNATNKFIHWICVPLIMLSLIGLLMCIPFPIDIPYLNWGTLALFAALVYYLRLSFQIFAGFVLIALIIIYVNNFIISLSPSIGWQPWMIFLLIFVLAWIGQFYGHKIEGKKPSFFQDLQFLLIGPAWLLHFVYNKMGIKY